MVHRLANADVAVGVGAVLEHGDAGVGEDGVRAAAGVEEHFEAGLVDVVLDQLPLERGGDVGFAGLDGGEAGDRLGADDLDEILDPGAVDAVEVFVADRVGVVADAAHLDVWLEGDELEGAAGEAVAVVALVAEFLDAMAGDDRHGGADAARRGDVGGDGHARGGVIDRGDFVVDGLDDVGDAGFVGSVVVVGGGALGAVDRELDVVGGERGSVVPGMPLIEVEKDGGEVLDPLEAGQVGDDLAGDEVVLHEAVEVDRRVEAGGVVAGGHGVEAADGVGNSDADGALPVGVALAALLDGLDRLGLLLLGLVLLLRGLLSLIFGSLLLLLLLNGRLLGGGLFLLLLLGRRLGDGGGLVVVVIAAADEGESGCADAGAGAGSEQCAAVQLRRAHSLPVVLLVVLRVAVAAHLKLLSRSTGAGYAQRIVWTLRNIAICERDVNSAWTETESRASGGAAEALIGQIVVRQLDLVTDRVNRTLSPRPESPDRPLLRL